MSEITVRAAPLDRPSRLLTFLIADIRGYTTFTHEQGDESATRLVGKFASVVRESVASRGGTVVEFRGDEALVSFDSAREALRASVELQQALQRETELDPSLPLRVGIGVDAGDAVTFEEGYRSGALNLAARLCALAGPGDVLASDSVVHLARKIEGVDTKSRGKITVKGLHAPVQVFQVAATGVLPDALPRLEKGQAGGSRDPLRPAAIVGAVGFSLSLVGALAAIAFGAISRTDTGAIALTLGLCFAGLLGALTVERTPRPAAFLYLVAAIGVVLTVTWPAMFGVPLFLIAAGQAMFTRTRRS